MMMIRTWIQLLRIQLTIKLSPTELNQTWPPPLMVNLVKRVIVQSDGEFLLEDHCCVVWHTVLASVCVRLISGFLASVQRAPSFRWWGVHVLIKASNGGEPVWVWTAHSSSEWQLRGWNVSQPDQPAGGWKPARLSPPEAVETCRAAYRELIRDCHFLSLYQSIRNTKSTNK